MKKGKFSKITLTFTLVAAMLLGCAAACSGSQNSAVKNGDFSLMRSPAQALS